MISGFFLEPMVGIEPTAYSLRVNYISSKKHLNMGVISIKIMILRHFYDIFRMVLFFVPSPTLHELRMNFIFVLSVYIYLQG